MSARTEIIDILDNVQGLRTLLKESNLAIPHRLNLNFISGHINQLSSYYITEKTQIALEIKTKILSKNIMKYKNQECATTQEFI